MLRLRVEQLKEREERWTEGTGEAGGTGGQGHSAQLPLTGGSALSLCKI